MSFGDFLTSQATGGLSTLGAGNGASQNNGTNTDVNQYVREGQGALDAQSRLIQQQNELQAALSPQLQATQLGGYQAYSQGLLGAYGNLNQGIADFQKQYAGQQLSMLGGLGQHATNAAIQGLDPNSRNLYNTFQQKALTDLQAGSGLNAQETDFAQQSARAAAQARGLQFSKQGSDLEILNTYQLGQQRLEQRQKTAMQGITMGQQQQQFGAQMFLAPAYQESQSFNLANTFAGGQEGYGQLGQSSFLTPESQYLANIRANRLGMQNANAAASAQKQAGMIAGGAAIAGAAIVAI